MFLSKKHLKILQYCHPGAQVRRCMLVLFAQNASIFQLFGYFSCLSLQNFIERKQPFTSSWLSCQPFYKRAKGQCSQNMAANVTASHLGFFSLFLFRRMVHDHLGNAHGSETITKSSQSQVWWRMPLIPY